MAIDDVTIRKALDSQRDLIANREHCSADPQLLTAIGCAVGQQVRVARGVDQYALYTVSETREETADHEVRVALAGRQRLGTADEFDAVIDSQVPHPTLTDAEAEATGELVERLDDDGAHTGMIAIAPHGGDIEQHTDHQAERVASRLAHHSVSSWRCKGWKRGGGAFDRWHITSTDIDEASFPALGSVISRGFTYAVAFHGFDEPGILIGGRAPAAVKREIEVAIERATAGSGIEVRIAGPDDGFGGDDRHNIVNRLTAGGTNGVQIEQSLLARSGYSAQIADAVADVYDRQLGSEPRPRHDRWQELWDWIKDRLDWFRRRHSPH